MLPIKRKVQCYLSLHQSVLLWSGLPNRRKLSTYMLMQSLDEGVLGATNGTGGKLAVGLMGIRRFDNNTKE